MAMEYIQSALSDPETLTRFLANVTGETVHIADAKKIDVADDLVTPTNRPDIQIANGRDRYMIYIGRCGMGRTVYKELQFYAAESSWRADGRVRIILIDEDDDENEPWMVMPAKVVGGTVDRVVDSGLICYVLSAGCDVVKTLRGKQRSARPSRKQSLRQHIAELEREGWSYSDAIIMATGLSWQWIQGYQAGRYGEIWKDGNEE